MTTVDQVTNCLKPKYPEIKCEQLPSKYPDSYASFEVGVAECHVEGA
nr:unnamed protein product [Callosobruchus analis]